jgi:hypothetical protein
VVAQLPGAPAGIATASNGTTYFGSAAYVLALSPAGVLTVVAGNGSGSPSGDGGPATQASLGTVYGLALDETNHLLYVAANGDRIRVVDLVGGNISLFAGTTSGPGSPGYGDGGQATAATLNYPYWIGLGPDGDLYVSDYYKGIRRIDPNSGTISTWMTADGASTTSLGIGGGCYYGNGCQIVWDATNSYAYIAANLYGSPTNPGYGIMRTDLAGHNRVLISGSNTSNYADNINATLASFRSQPQLAFQYVGGVHQLFASDYSSNKVRLINLDTGIITTAAGVGGTSAFSGDYGAATAAQLYNPEWIAVTGGHLLLSDVNNYAVREVW